MPGEDRTLFSSSLSAFLHRLGTLVFIPALTALVGVDVVLRYLLSAPLAWGVDVGSLLLLLVFLSSLPDATVRGRHIRMELVYDKLPPPLRRMSDIVSALGGLCLSGFLTYQSTLNAFEMFQHRERPVLVNIPFWPFAVVMAAVRRSAGPPISRICSAIDSATRVAARST